MARTWPIALPVAFLPAWPVVVLLLLAASGCTRTQAPPRDARFAIPPTDDGIPGAGPIRRADWFQQGWEERRTYFASRRERDRGAIVFAGDSISQRWGDDFRGLLPGCRLANRGIDGDTSRGLLYRLSEDVLSLDPSAVVVIIGSNDIEDGVSAGVPAENVRLILGALKAHSPTMRIVLGLALPSSALVSRPAAAMVELNRRITAVAAGDARVVLADTWSGLAGPDGEARPELFEDLIHPTQQGYQQLAATLWPHLSDLCAAEGGSSSPSRQRSSGRTTWR